MIHTVKGKLQKKTKSHVIVEAGSFGLKISTNEQVVNELPQEGKEVKLFTFFYVRDNDFELYGFTNERALKLFEMLNSVSGIGPKTALGVLNIDSPDRVIASIVEKKTDFLTKASGIGEKTAERVILELHRDLKIPKSDKIAKTIDVDEDVIDALVSLGYTKRHSKDAVNKLDGDIKGLEERLKEALKILS